MKCHGMEMCSCYAGSGLRLYKLADTSMRIMLMLMVHNKDGCYSAFGEIIIKLSEENPADKSKKIRLPPRSPTAAQL